jgi:hypothetical protein
MTANIKSLESVSMPSQVHLIDIHADTVIILSDPLRTFAPWEPEVVRSDKKKKKKGMKCSSRNSVLMSDDGPTSQATDTIVGADYPPIQEPSVVESSVSETANPGPQIDKILDESIHYHVSSRHLMVASSWFMRAMTKEGWAESSRNEEDKLFNIKAANWDPEAFLILLNIFHLRNRQVPRTVSLEMLAKIAVLVDYYHDCGEAIELFTTIWIDHLRANSTIPTTYCRDLVLWICIARVFNLRDDFNQATLVAVTQSEETFRTLRLPISSSVCGESIVIFTITVLLRPARYNRL